MKIKEQPVYTHDCSSCVFLGRSISDKHNNESVDVYWCKSSSDSSLDAIIGRYGNEGPEYMSYHPPEALAGADEYLDMADKWYLFALVKAARIGLYKFRKSKK